MVTNRFFSIIRRVSIFAGVALVSILLLFTIGSVILFQQKEEWLLEQVQLYMNQTQSGQVEIATVKLKLLKAFPQISVEFNGVNYYEHRDSLRKPDEQPILHAERLFVTLRLWPMINSELDVSEISLSVSQ